MTYFFTNTLGPFSLYDLRRKACLIQGTADESSDSGTFLGFAEVTVSVQCSHLPSSKNLNYRFYWQLGVPIAFEVSQPQRRSFDPAQDDNVNNLMFRMTFDEILRLRSLRTPPPLRGPGQIPATSINATVPRTDRSFQLTSPLAKYPPLAVATGSPHSPLKTSTLAHFPGVANPRMTFPKEKRVGSAVPGFCRDIVLPAGLLFPRAGFGMFQGFFSLPIRSVLGYPFLL